MKNVYILFQTDSYKTRSSRVLFGVYESKEMAIAAAKQEELYNYESEVVILETLLNDFLEQ